MAQHKEEQKAVILGKASFIDFEAFIAWTDTDEADDFFSTKNLWTGYLYNLQSTIPGIVFSKLHDAARSRESREQHYKNPLIRYFNYINTYSSPEKPLSFSLLFEHDKIDVIAFGNHQFLVPVGYLIKTPLKDYSETPISLLREQAGLTSGASATSDSLIPITSNNISVQEQKNHLSEQAASLSALKQEIDDVQNARSGELAKLQEEIDRQIAILQSKKDALMEHLNAKLEALEALQKQMEQQLFMLESEIYSIRCFTGEVVDFICLRSGVPAEVDAPITLFQKFRFLDEEMGKATCLYDFDFNDSKLFEDLLKKDDNAFELFCPNDKCVSLVRVSKTGLSYGYSETPYGPLLAEYEVFHGNTIGILIRNGENLYIGWTDDEKINMPDNMFFMPGEKEIDIEDENKIESTPIKQAVSRYFIFTILQGVLASGSMLTLPKGVKAKFSQPSQYIIYSAADRWLVDNRYGTFRDLVDKVNEVITVGDDILSITYASDGNRESASSSYRSYNRDRNYSHRTHDVYFQNGVIYKINLIEEDEYGDIQYYVSLPKSWGDSEYVYRNGEYIQRQREARANFAVDKCEFINLTYMNSVWLQYVITTRNLGSFGYRDKMNSFAEAIRYLNKALMFVREREKEEKALIEAFYPNLANDPEWPVKLSEWKMANHVRKINNYQAKRFAKTL